MSTRRNNILICSIIIITLILLVVFFRHLYMPKIVFTYWEYNSEYNPPDNKSHPYDAWIIDRNGNIYHSYNMEINFEQAPEKCKKIGHINQRNLAQHYSSLQHMLNSNHYKLSNHQNSNLKPNYYVGSKHWNGYCYTILGEKKQIDLYHESDISYYNENPTGKKLADWIIKVIQQYDEYSPVLYLNEE